MGCTREAYWTVNGDLLVKEERTYEHGRLATETRAVERMALLAP